MEPTSSMRKDSDAERKSIQKKSVAVALDLLEESTAVKEKPRTSTHYYGQEIDTEIQHRMQFRVLETIDEQEVDLTPNCIPDLPQKEKFFRLNLQLANEISNLPDFHTRNSSIRSKTRSSMRGGIGGNKQSIDEIINGITYETITFEPATVQKVEEVHIPVPYKKSFVKVTLRKSIFVVLHSQVSNTVAKGTSQGDVVEADNKLYEYLTVGKGKVRRRADNDAQTNLVLTNTRAMNTIVVDYATVGSYVSNFEMYDTMQGVGQKPNVQLTMHSLTKPADEAPTPRMSDGGTSAMDDDEAKERGKLRSMILELFRKPEFIQATRIIGRTLSSNQFDHGMQRFRNFNEVHRCSLTVQYKYSMKLLFRLIPAPSREERKAVSDISFCTSNSDILAIGYGLFSFSSQQVPVTGEVYVWSIKNPARDCSLFLPLSANADCDRVVRWQC
ncbi:GH23218 [Drosophila grimshawi]|uniref:GH23218 n=1 Tax=Drosophila grimshawi TaxID=7222 RepID=B4K169_DROGR|nr:GH23218 [Drosophila grimshawi]